MKKLASLLLSSILMLSNSNATVVPSNTELILQSDLIVTGTVMSIHKNEDDSGFFIVHIDSVKKGGYYKKTIRIPFNNSMMNIKPMIQSKIDNESITVLFLVKSDDSWQLADPFVGIQ